jgi:FdrA protein
MDIMRFEVRAGAYYDSVVLMQLQRDLAAMPGVQDAGVVMATEANRELLAASGLLPDATTNPEAAAAKADDLLIVVKGDQKSAVDQALKQVDTLLQRRRSATSQSFRPRSLAVAAKSLPDARWVLISVPGRYAAGVAREALDLGKHVFLYSDNVSIEEEVELKQIGRERGLIVMGPDCGTAIINGIGLGFANRVRSGDIGLVGASGTGLQAITSEIHNLGGGISQAIGTGGRDLKAKVGAITAGQAMAMLAKDERTKVILLVSKPPAPSVVTRLLATAQNIGKPVVVNLIGYPIPGRQLGNLHFVSTLYDAAELAVQLSNIEVAELAEPCTPLAGYLRGLFSGGTIAYEVLLGLQAILSPLYSNIPVREDQRLESVLKSVGHTILDLGEDEFTQGRLHPMMDNDLRLRRMRQELEDPQVGLIMLDVVLGAGSHPDPATELSPAIAEAKKHGKKVVVIVVGTDDDPQDLLRQIEGLMAAGATVFATASEALDYVFNRVPPPVEDAFTPIDPAAFEEPLAAINVGLESFYDSLQSQKARTIQVDWRPPAGGNEQLMAILAKMKA